MFTSRNTVLRIVRLCDRNAQRVFVLSISFKHPHVFLSEQHDAHIKCSRLFFPYWFAHMFAVARAFVQVVCFFFWCT